MVISFSGDPLNFLVICLVLENFYRLSLKLVINEVLKA